VDQDWLSTWRISVSAILTEFLASFRQRFGFEPGTNGLGPPASREALASLAAIRPPPAHDLLALYRNVGEVSLPDVGNGYFIHSPRLVIQQKQNGEPRRIGPPFDVDVLAFASDGGGALYALPAAAAGPVYRLRDCAIRDGVADARGGRIVAKDLQEFLQRLEIAVKTYAGTGKPTDL
jgi:hypothetical protein